MKHKKIFATIVVIACTLMLVIGCNVTSHEDVMKSDSATIEQSDKADSKDVQKDKSDKASDKKSDEKASADKKSDKDADKESSTSADESDSKSDSSASKPSGNSSSSHSGSSASKPSSNSGSSSKPSGNSGSSSKPSNNSGGNSASTSTPEPSKPAHEHSWTTNYKTVTHDAVYEDRPVYEERSVYEDRPVYTWVGYYQCKKCGFQSEDVGTMLDHCMDVCDSTYTSLEKQVQTGTERVQVGTEQVQTGTTSVKVKDAWTEQVPNGQVCSTCGDTRH